MHDSMKGKEIRTLLIVLTSGIAAALLMTFGMLKIYNPEGVYSAGNLLLTPANAYSLEFTEPGSKAKTDVKYKFKGITYTFYDQSKREWVKKTLTQAQYEAIYALMKNDVSLVNPSFDVINYFSQHRLANIEIKVNRLGTDAQTQTELNFSEIAITEQGDHYRITLRQSGGDFNWAYFYHRGIFSDLLKLIGD